jgi:hypothetical protein
VADDYSWSGSTIFSLANPSSTRAISENGELWPILNRRNS